LKARARIAGIAIALVALALVMGHLAGLFGEKIPAQKLAASAAPVRGATAVVDAVTEPVIEQATGTVRSRNEAVVSARITATITAIPVTAGDTVGLGDVLVELDSRELRARLEQQRQAVAAARANLSEAQPNYARMQALFSRGTVAKADLDRAEARLRAAEAELARARRAVEEAETALSYAVIRAPLAGRVIDRVADPGDTARPGEPLLRLYDPEHLRLEANVRESLAAGLSRGQRLRARIDALDLTTGVTVEEIVPLADPGSRSFLVKATLPASPNLYPGMFGRLLIESGTTTRLYVPAAAVEHIGQLEFVRVATAEGTVRRMIRTGRRDENDRLEVLAGLAPGEEVVLPP